MKNKRLAIILTILLFLAIIVVLSSTVFSLASVDIVFYTTTNVLTGQDDDIITSGKFNLGENVLFVNKSLHTTLLEKAYPYLKVENIETIFPNKLLINAVERNEVFAIKTADNKYAICDEELKVLKIQPAFYNNPQNSIELTVTNDVTDISAGDFISLTQNKLINKTFYCLREWNDSYVNLKANVSSVVIDYQNRTNQILINMRSGVKIIVKDADKFLSEKMNLAFSFYENSDQDYTREGTIEIRQLSNGNISGFYYTDA